MEIKEDVKWSELNASLQYNLCKMGGRLKTEGNEVVLYSPSEAIHELIKSYLLRNESAGMLSDEFCKAEHLEKLKLSPVDSGVYRDYDWEALLKNWSSLKGAEAVKEYGLPKDVDTRVRVLQKLRTFCPKEDIPVYYEHLVRYSLLFSTAYGPKALKEIVTKGRIRGYDLVEEVKFAVRSGLIRKDEGEVVLYAYPRRKEAYVTEDESVMSYSFVEELS